MSETPPLFEDSQSACHSQKIVDLLKDPDLEASTQDRKVAFSNTYVIKRHQHSPDVSAKKKKVNEDMIVEKIKDAKDPGVIEIEDDEAQEPEDLIRFRQEREKLRKVIEELTAMNDLLGEFVAASKRK